MYMYFWILTVIDVSVLTLVESLYSNSIDIKVHVHVDLIWSTVLYRVLSLYIYALLIIG